MARLRRGMRGAATRLPPHWRARATGSRAHVVAAGLGLGVLTGCIDLSFGPAAPAVDTPAMVWAAPDSVRVGARTTVYALGCPPGWSACVGPVRDLRWAVSDRAVLVLERTGRTASSTSVRGRAVGVAWVIAIGPAGRDSALVRILP